MRAWVPWWTHRQARRSSPCCRFECRGLRVRRTRVASRADAARQSARRGIRDRVGHPYQSSHRSIRRAPQNLIVGLIASVALLIAVAVIGLRTPQYLRGKYLESELLLAKRVQRDLQPKPNSISADVEFAASAVAADHVGGDFYDIFEATPARLPSCWVMFQAKACPRLCWSVCCKAPYALPRHPGTNLPATGSTACYAS